MGLKIKDEATRKRLLAMEEGRKPRNSPAKLCNLTPAQEAALAGTPKHGHPPWIILDMPEHIPVLDNGVFTPPLPATWGQMRPISATAVDSDPSDPLLALEAADHEIAPNNSSVGPKSIFEPVNAGDVAPSGAPLAVGRINQLVITGNPLPKPQPSAHRRGMFQSLNYTFTVPERPVGYVRMTRAGKWTANAKRAHRYMALVQECARKQGFELPLMATPERPLRIDTQIFCADKRGPDPDNVQKLVVDALFYKKGKGKNADKWHYGAYGPYQVDAHHPRVEVRIWTEAGLAWVRANKAKGAGNA